MAIKRPRLYNTGNRDTDTVSAALSSALRQIDNSFAAQQDTLDALTTSRVMPVDAYHYAYWPCDDASGETTLHQTVSSGPAGLVCSAQAVPGAAGFVLERAIRLTGGTAANRLATITPSAPSMSTATVALWLRLGESVALGTSIFGWRDSTFGDNTGVRLAASATEGHLIEFYVTVGGTLYAISADTSFYLSNGTWHHVGLTYDGETTRGYIDGTLAATDTTPSGAISWTTGAGTKSWRIGTASLNGQPGFYNDVRVISGVMPATWFAEAFRRGYRCLS